MPSQPYDTGWDFGPVLDLIDSDISIASPSDSPTHRTALPVPKEKHVKEQASAQSLHLGDFSKLFEQLGISNGEPLPPISPVEPDSEDPSSSDDVPPPFSDVEKDNINDRGDVIGCSLPPTELKAPFEELDIAKSKQLLRKERKRNKKEAAKQIKTQILVQKAQQQVDRILAQRRESVDIELSTPRVEPSHQPARVQPRSYVGAKVSPDTPIQRDLSQKQPKPPIQPKQSNDVPAHHLSSFAQPFTPTNQHGRSSATPAAGAHLSPALVDLGSTLATQYTSFGTLAQPLTPFYSGSYFTPQAAQPNVYNHGLIPRTVQPVVPQYLPHPVSIPAQPQFSSTSRSPRKSFTIRPQVDRHFHFFNQLMTNFPDDKKWLVSPKQLCNEKTSSDGIHIFVDISNIMIGFLHSTNKYNSQRFDMSFDSLALLMERRRPVAKRVFAGSHREANPHPHLKKLAETSRDVGYENNVKEQVFICREDTDRKKFFKDVDRLGWDAAVQRRSGSGSDSETGQRTPSTPSAPKWVEQGVDEILHLKMCQSIIDTEVPTTMVLATGDGAQAEHSDGFLAHVERALKKGWKVELVSFKKQTSGGYTNKRFRAKWGDKFRIIELDEYLESLVDTV